MGSPSQPTPHAAATGERPVVVLEKALGARWDAIHQTHACTEELRAKLTAALREAHLDRDEDCAVIVTGSLGRGEASHSSDVDWVLLVDGPSNPDHTRMARRIRDCVASMGLKDVGPTGTFGEIVASHSLVHHIAGIRDSNENLTRRMLLLAESYALTGKMVRERVIRNVLARYITYDRPAPTKSGFFDPIPYFLLNDVVRYWRTIASDYASKMWERNRQGWATRNVKLRFSRKLLLVWGLLACFSGMLFPSSAMRETNDAGERLMILLELVRRQADISPLDLLASVAIHEEVSAKTAKRIFDAYNVFLTELSGLETRHHLDTVAFEDAPTDEVYHRLRLASGSFRSGINRLFFDEHPDLSKLIRKYGVF